MENNNTQTYEVKDVLGFVVNGLGNIVLPVSILGALNPEQIMAIKQLVSRGQRSRRSRRCWRRVCFRRMRRSSTGRRRCASKNKDQFNAGGGGRCSSWTRTGRRS